MMLLRSSSSFNKCVEHRAGEKNKRSFVSISFFKMLGKADARRNRTMQVHLTRWPGTHISWVCYQTFLFANLVVFSDSGLMLLVTHSLSTI